MANGGTGGGSGIVGSDMSATEASYEVCILVGSRWEIQARYPGTGATSAIEEAKQLERVTRSAVKVVREVYDSESGLYRQSTVYKSAQAPATKINSPASRVMRARSRMGSAAGEADDLFDEGEFDEPHDTGQRRGSLADWLSYRRRPSVRPPSARPPARPKRITVAGLLVRVAFFIVISLFAAGLATVLLPSLAPELAVRNITLFGAGQASVLFVVFLAAFLVTFALLAAILLSGVEVVWPRRRVRSPPAAKPPARRPRRRSRLPEPDDALIQEPPAPSPEPEEPAPPAEGEPESPADEEEEEENLLEEPSAEEENLLEEAPDEGEAAEPQLSPDGQHQKMRMMTFLAGAIEAIKSSGPIDPFSRFGINLYVAGAVGALATTQAIDDADARIILAEGAVTLGTPWDMARKFAENVDSYLMQPRYLEMYEAGRRSMMAFLEGDDDGPRLLTGALDAWRNPARREEQAGPLAVMFTDIVGSTNMTVTLGDAAAHYVVRTHNRIVRSALANHSGREIKHTGDGIMASFATVSNAVEAAIEILRRVEANNAAEGDVPLHLRIGINAGEPVMEDDDLFGVTVQLSARLCAAAESDQIMVSEVVRSLCSGKDVAFKAQGIREMKGFQEPVPLYEVVWRRDGS